VTRYRSTDRDRSLRKQTGQIVHPLFWSSILYVNGFPSSPTVVLDQLLSFDGKSWISLEATSGRSLDAVPNHYAAFRGDLRHGVVFNEAAQEADGPSRQADEPPELRLTLLVNYWDRRPAPPNCRDYDGTIYPSIQHQAVIPAAALPLPPLDGNERSTRSRTRSFFASGSSANN
jgi:hypothetical protein